MTREDAIAALTALPIGRPQRIDPAPHEVIVCECIEPVPVAGVQHIAEQLRSIWPAHRIVIVQAGIRIHLEPAMEGSAHEQAVLRAKP